MKETENSETIFFIKIHETYLIVLIDRIRWENII